MKRWLFGVAALALFGSASASLVLDWTKQFDGAGPAFDGRDKLIGDTSGNAYLVHEPVKPATSSRDVTLTKFAPDGTVAWERALPNSSAVNERSGQVAANATLGAIAYTGFVRVGSEDRAVISAVKPDGTVIFTTDLGPATRLHSVHGFGTNEGFIVTMEAPGLFGSRVVQVARVSSTGARLWKESFAVSQTVQHQLVSAAASTSGVVLGGFYLVPEAEGPGIPHPFLVAFDLNGEEVWDDAFIPGVGSVVGIQTYGSTTLAQTQVSDEEPNLLLKYGPTGSIIWRSRFDPILGASPIAGHGGSGGVSVAMNNPRAWGAVRVRYTSTYPVPYGMYPLDSIDRQAEAVTHDNAGVIIAGRALQTTWRPAMAKYDDLTRDEVWSYTSTTPSSFGRAYVLPNGAIVLMGRTADNQVLLHRFTQAIAVQKVETSVTSGNASVDPTIKVTLAFPAPLGGIKVNLSSNSTKLVVPATVTVPAGQTSISTQSSSLPVAASTAVKITATTGAISKQANYTLLPPKVQSVEIDPTSGYGGDPYTLVLKLDSHAPASFACTLTAPAALGLPSTVTFSQSPNLEIVKNVPNTAVDTNHVIKLSKNGITKQATLKALRPKLSGVYLNGSWSTGTMTHDGGDPLKITLTLRGKSSAAVPVTMSENLANLTGGNFSVPAGQTSVEVFRNTTLPSAMAVAGQISFSVFGTSKAGNLAILRARAASLTGPGTIAHSLPSVFQFNLKKPAASGGVKVTLIYPPGLAKLGITNPVFTVPAGSTSKTFILIPPKPNAQVDGILKGTISTYSSATRPVKVNP